MPDHTSISLCLQPDARAELTNACAVVKPTPLRFTPVTKTVLPRMDSAKALATSKPSVFSPKLG